MKSHIKISYLPFIFLLLISCERERLSGNKEILVGPWNWTYSDAIHFCNGYAQYDLFDPVSENATFQIKITKSGTLSYFRDGQLLSKHNVKTEYVNIDENGIVDSNKKIDVTFSLNGDSEKTVSFRGTQKEIKVSNFPKESNADCHYTPQNYFVLKQ